MRWAGGFLVAASACYSPSAQSGAPCDPALDNCPAGQRCVMTGSGSFCGAMPDDEIDAGPPPDAQECFGAGFVTNVCFKPLPMNDVFIDTNRTINTATVGDGNCDQIIAQASGGSSLCMIAGRSITIQATAKLTGVGPNPLLLIATGTIAVDGTIDVASHIGSMALGAGADTTCASPNGGNGSGADGGGAGGAGGSFATAGGGGGNGRNGGNGGVALAAMTPTSVRGGCAGGRGGAGTGGGGAGAAGNGGGAVYLIAGTSLTVGGTINASGAAGTRGTNAAGAGSGGGGGGAGGMIGLDAPSITITGSVFANGGGGGGGNGDQFNRPGQNGDDPTSATTAASGGPGGAGGGGDGGDGYAATIEATRGDNGAAQFCGGGGGGGGGGVIRVFGPPPSSVNGAISPPAT